MTDITELAQRMKAAAVKATPGEWRRDSTQFNGITATPFMLGRKEVMIAVASEKRDAEFIALANPANILALVEALEKSDKTSEARREAIDITHKRAARERDRANAAEEALEKAQAKIIELQRKYEIDPRTHEIIDLEERVAELESEVEKWKQEAEAWEQVAEKQLATAIALESRAVMLERQLVDHVDEDLLITIKAASALDSLPKTGEVQNTNFPAIPDGYVIVAASLLSDLRDWAYPEIEEYCEMWAVRRDDEFPALRKVIADTDALLAVAPQSPGSEPASVPGKWIPVSERMPEREVDVQVYCPDKKEQMVAYLERNELDGYFRFATWRTGDGIYCQPTHWMQLPAAPQEVR